MIQQVVAFASQPILDVGVITSDVVDSLSGMPLPDVTAAVNPCRYTPELSWVEPSYRQAGKHLHAAEAADIAVLMGAWGEMGYTPRDRLFLNQVRRARPAGVGLEGGAVCTTLKRLLCTGRQGSMKAQHILCHGRCSKVQYSAEQYTCGGQSLKPPTIQTCMGC
jgi:hypothetical protein